MSLSAYKSYKLTENSWIEKIPEHWNIKKLKFVAKPQPSNVDKKTVEGEVQVRLCNYTDVYKNEFIGASMDFMEATATTDEINKFKLDVGDVIVTKDSETPQDIAVPALVIEAADDLVCGYHLTQIKQRGLNGSYLFRLFQSKSFNAQFIVQANGVTRFGLPSYAIDNAQVPVPSIQEQKQIAEFLDYKTTQIDALIAKKEELLLKLQEKRAALITHVVTKGINPNAPMKDSGVVWLGKVPSHWSVKKLKFVAKPQPSNVDKKTVEGEVQVRLCNYTDVYKNEFINSSMDFMEATATNTEIKKFKLDIGDVIVTKDSETPQDIAVPALVIEAADDLVCGYHLTQIKQLGLNGRYLFRLLQSKGFNAQFIVQANGVTRFGLPSYAIDNARTPIPPSEEQKQISDFIEFKTAQIDDQSNKVKEVISKLQEYRSALITNAVTGKIDVRAVAIPDKYRN